MKHRNGTATLLAAAFLSGATAAAQAAPMTFAGSTVQIKYFDIDTQENVTIADSDTSDIGEAVSASASHFVGQSHIDGDGDQGIGEAPALASSSGSADLAAAQIKVRADSEIRLLPSSGNTQASISNVVSAGFGDHFTTTIAGGSPFDWTSGGVGRFDLRLGGDLIKANDDGDTPISFGIASWTVRLVATGPGPDPVKGICDWRQIVGGFDSTPPPNHQPYREIFAVSSENTSNECDFSGSLEGGDLMLSAGVNLGGDFDWILSLAASARIGELEDVLEVDLGNTLDVSYSGPDGTITTASVFGGILQDDTPSDDDPPAGVPAPGALALFGLGLFGLGLARRRR